jgi:hypothetical protein
MPFTNLRADYTHKRVRLNWMMITTMATGEDEASINYLNDPILLLSVMASQCLTISERWPTRNRMRSVEAKVMIPWALSNGQHLEIQPMFVARQIPI